MKESLFSVRNLVAVFVASAILSFIFLVLPPLLQTVNLKESSNCTITNTQIDERTCKKRKCTKNATRKKRKCQWVDYTCYDYTATVTYQPQDSSETAIAEFKSKHPVKTKIEAQERLEAVKVNLLKQVDHSRNLTNAITTQMT